MLNMPARARLIALISFGIILLAASLLYWRSKHIGHYTVYDGDNIQIISGQYEVVSEVLNAAGITIGTQDKVTPGVDQSINQSEAIQISRAKPVTVYDNGVTNTIWTTQKNIASFLSEAKIKIGQSDELIMDGRIIPWDQLEQESLSNEISIDRKSTITIHDGNSVVTWETEQETVGQALREAGYNLFAADTTDPPLGSWITPELHININRSLPLMIEVDGRLIETRSHFTRTQDVLSEVGISLFGQDFTRPPLDETLEVGDLIQVIRVTEDFRIEDEPIPYDTVWQATDSLEIDQRSLLSQGVPGILRNRIRIRYENGTEVSQFSDGEWIEQNPVNEVMGYGTGIVIRTIETDAGVFEYWRVLRMRATAYTASSSGKPPDHPAFGITASGIQAGTGVVAIDPNVIPFRSWVYIPGYGVGYAGDTGGGIKGRWIDLGYDEDELVAWNTYADVYLLTPAPAPEDINYLVPSALP
jgi:uncharacterized protein YabE (DUF348 family)